MELTPEQIKLVNIMDVHYSPAVPEATQPLLQSTTQVFAKLQSVYPSQAYTPEDVHQVLQYLNYQTIDSTDGDIKWLMSEQQS